jgi:RHS repeat-associated protein
MICSNPKAFVALVFLIALASARAETTIYVNEHFEVREHDQPVKYVTRGGTRVARVTGSLSGSTRVQRLRLLSGWNLCSVAVGGSPLPRRIVGQSADTVIAAYRWSSSGQNWTHLLPTEPLVAGTTLWLRATTNLILSITGVYPHLTNGVVAAGGSFQASAGLVATPLRAKSSSGFGVFASASFNAVEQRWLIRLPSILQNDSHTPDFVAPGQAVFIHADAPAELEIPDVGLDVRYYHQDHLGSSSVIADAEGQLVEETAFYPSGIPRHENRLEQIEEAYQFTQKERDDESGLHYFEARYLAGSLARFVSVDPKYASPELLSERSLSAFLSVPQRMNLYTYARNNPLKYWDPTGLDEKKKDPGLVDTADTFVDRMGFIADVNKVKGPGLVFDIAGVGIKTVKLVDEPSVMRGVAVGYDVTKAALTAKVPPVGLVLQGLDLIGIGPGTFIDWAADEIDETNARIEEKRQLAETYRKTAETYKKLAEIHRQEAVRIEAETFRIKAETKKIQAETREAEDSVKRMDERIRISDELLKKARSRR